MTNSDSFSLLITVLTIFGTVFLASLILPHPNMAPYPPGSTQISYATSTNASWHPVNEGSTGILGNGQWFAVPITAPKNATEMTVYADIVPTSVPMTMGLFGSGNLEACLVNKEELQLLENGATVPAIEATDLTVIGKHYTFVTKKLPADTYYLIIKNGNNPINFGIRYHFIAGELPTNPTHPIHKNENGWINRLDYGSANYIVDVYY